MRCSNKRLVAFSCTCVAQRTRCGAVLTNCVLRNFACFMLVNKRLAMLQCICKVNMEPGVTFTNRQATFGYDEFDMFIIMPAE